MNKKTIGEWIMYHQIQRLIREGFSLRAVAKSVGMDYRTVGKYAAMNEVEFTAQLEKRELRQRILHRYEEFIKDRLIASPAATAAQVHDWLKEHHPDFPYVNPKTVYNAVMWLRQKHGIAREEIGREYFAVEELPYGLQAQADFGQYIMRHAETTRKKVYFFVMTLSRSRMKFVRFSPCPFTTATAIDAHEEAFEFFQGIPKQIVYDQDRLFLVDEHMGELLLTQEFKAYVFEQEFSLHFCRKGDPESKGKIENVVKFVKGNFLYGRAYYDIETLQGQALQWLQRTGNGMPHAATRKVPAEEWMIEKGCLTSWAPIKILPSYILRFLRKDNTFSYSGNLYSVPQGTYKNKDSAVAIYLRNAELHIYDDQRQFLCKHTFITTKGYKIINADHKRDKSQKTNDLITTTAAMFLDPVLAREYFEMIRKVKSRYFRDQLQVIRGCIHGCDKQAAAAVLQQCVTERYLSASIFKELLALNEAQKRFSGDVETATGKVILLDPDSMRKAESRPDKSDLDAYEQAFRDT
jgi:transposase